jgi:hypothetical protein
MCARRHDAEYVLSRRESRPANANSAHVQNDRYYRKSLPTKELLFRIGATSTSVPESARPRCCIAKLGLGTRPPFACTDDRAGRSGSRPTGKRPTGPLPPAVARDLAPVTASCHQLGGAGQCLSLSRPLAGCLAPDPSVPFQGPTVSALILDMASATL